MTAPLADQHLAEVEGFLDVWDAAPAHRTGYRDVISSQKSGEDGRKLRASTLRALVADVRRLRGELGTVLGQLATVKEGFDAQALAERQRLARALADRNDEYDALKAEFDQFAEVCASHSADRCVEQVAAEDLQVAYDRLGEQAQRITEAASRFRSERDRLHDAFGDALVGAWEANGAGDVRSPWIPAGEVAGWRQVLARTERSEHKGEVLAAQRGTEEAPDFHRCAMCGERCYWQECPTGGWWAHEIPSGGDHDAVAGAPCRPGADDYCEPPTEAPQNGPAAPAGDSRSSVDAHGGEVAQRGAAGRDGHTQADTDRARRNEIARALHEYADKLDAVPINATALTGPVWYGAGWHDAVNHLRDLADGLMPAPSADSGSEP